MTALKLVSLYIATVDHKKVIAAVTDLIEPGDTVEDVEALCIVLVDSLIPSEVVPAWDAAVEPVIESAGRRLARWMLALAHPSQASGDRTRRRISPIVERALSDAAKARARAAEVAALPSVSVEEPA
jgi:hypothetical protein